MVKQYKSDGNFENDELSTIRLAEIIYSDLKNRDLKRHHKNRKDLKKINLNEVSEEKQLSNIYYNYMYDITII
ncbi:hypothetical protein ACFVR2_08750 [Gottfriedia sp. NPDC057991]|uniref:hypothetical protein n=1 Tax=Gottfriedia sp. NPDC057991 TaxID=3346298 RepID=UPI0036DC9994